MSPIIDCQGLSKYFANKEALHQVSFEVNSGDTVGLVGPNGAGKTTLLRILCGYLHPSTGLVTILGEKPGSKSLLGKLSALPQDAQFDPVFSIETQLTHYARLQGFSKKNGHNETMRVLELMQLRHSANSKPGALSHGMRKRAAIAQSLIGQPQLVLLDEPTAGLDPVNARNIRQLISDLSDQTTFLISSHNLQELEHLCETILLLENGHLIPQAEAPAKSSAQFLTLRMERVLETELSTAINQIPGVESVSNQQKNEFIIKYDQSKAPHLDQNILQLIAENGWQYRQLINGQTLEEQLFSS
ncbi:MAG: ABC transporter ATP-binding protein [Pseudomonadales bacterium]|nr:ABC transporter ATP-binding protein [Pseudomonadales bacterium]